jgi:hypothetical protein
MKYLKVTWTALVIGGCIFLASAPAKADTVTLTLTSPFQTGVWGNVLEFDATVTNTTAGTIYLNADSPTLSGPLVLDDSGFFNNFPLSLAPSGDPGDTFTGELFTVTIPPGTPYTLYPGVFEILGGDPSDYADVISSAYFDVVVTPEPPSWELLAMALTGLLAVAGRKSLWRQTAV